ncbi:MULTISPECIES: EpsG family protein [unclassified Adlercreutzia]|uniref:EpsG family protein n=1 Tax=unclassified Adlercreutzia TaxID=2636013 RepID=UPI0013EBE189|nr:MULTISPECIES: EpsG family protein [unclassified Adlercreutzia]
MSPYIVLGIIMVLLAALGASSKWSNICFAISFLVLTLFLTLRFGQGTDWLSYNYIFACAPDVVDFGSYFYTKGVHAELGWKVLNNIWKALGFGYVELSVALSLVDMALLGRFVRRYSPNGSLSLLLAFPVVYLVYFFSVMRQGLVIAVFLGIMIDLLREGRAVRYCLLIALLCSIHSIAIVLAVPLIATRLSFRSLSGVLGVSVVFGVAVAPFLGAILPTALATYSGGTFSPVAVLYRVVMASLIYMMHFSVKNSAEKKDGSDAPSLLLKVYIVGLALYSICMGNDLIASRLAAPLLALEIAIIPILASQGASKLVMPLMLSVLLMVGVMTVKNISSFVDQGPYYSYVTVWNYPYITIFNQSDIYLYCNNRYLPYLRIGG